jgi:hypothetical protein
MHARSRECRQLRSRQLAIANPPRRGEGRSRLIYMGRRYPNGEQVRNANCKHIIGVRQLCDM